VLALRFTGPRAASVVESEPPEPAPGEVLVAPRYVGLCGTDLELLTGVMPYFAAGQASYPIQPGHEVSGVVVESGTQVMIDPGTGCGACAACTGAASEAVGASAGGACEYGARVAASGREEEGGCQGGGAQEGGG